MGDMKKSDKGVNESTKARAPFRKLRDVRLSYSPKGKLQSVVATAFIPKAKPDIARKELDLCCRDLEKNGIVFQKEWDTSGGEGILEKRGHGDGVSEVIVRGDLNAKLYGSRAGASIEIQVYWDVYLADIGSSDMITPKAGTYDPNGKITRQVLVENAFGIKFGTKVPDKLIEPFKERLRKGGVDIEKFTSGMHEYPTRMSRSILGMNAISLVCSGPSEEICGVSLARRGTTMKASADVKREFAKLRKDVEKWLGVDFPEPEEQDIGGGMNMVSSSFEDEDVRVVVISSMEAGGARSSVSITKKSEIKSAKVVGSSRSHANTSRPATLSAAAKMRIKKVERRMKKIILPAIEFSTTQTIIDAVDFFNRAARDIEEKNGIPKDECGFNHVWTSKDRSGKKRPVEPFKSKIEASGISLWDAWHLVCSHAKYKMELVDHDNGGGCFVRIAPLDE